MTSAPIVLSLLIALTADPCDTTLAAGAFACVSVILEPLPRNGAWADVDHASSEVWLSVGDDVINPVRVGTAVPAGATIRTDRARVAVRLQDGGVARLTDGSRLTVGNTFDQLIGNVWYILRRVTSVRFGAVEAAVEGTSFHMYSDGIGQVVGVREGTVNVRYGAATQRVHGDEVLLIAGDSLSAPRPWSSRDQYDLSRSTWRAGHPTLVIGASAGIGTVGKYFAPPARVNALLRVGARVGVSVDGWLTPWSGGDGLRRVTGGGLRYFLSRLPPPPDRDRFDYNQFVVHHASLGFDLVRVVDGASTSPQWGGAIAYDFAFPRYRLALLVQAKLGVLQGPRIFWSFSYGIGLAL